MAKSDSADLASTARSGASRGLKIVVVALLIPLAIGLLQGVLRQLEFMTDSGGTFREWMTWGFMTYVWLHVLVYRPAPLFRVSHRLFSVLAVWLFGGQVASTEGGAESKGRRGKGEAQGSTLVAFSPYVIPLYAILVCASGLVLRQWMSRSFIDGPLTFFVGLSAAFHWLMTADDLQQQRDRWHVETYLLAIGLVFVVTLVIGGACLPWAIPEFSFLDALADGVDQAQATYARMASRLF
jgi:hypothetical protein